MVPWEKQTGRDERLTPSRRLFRRLLFESFLLEEIERAIRMARAVPVYPFRNDREIGSPPDLCREDRSISKIF